MAKLDFYIAKSIFLGIVMALFVIAAIDWLGDIFYQVGRMSTDDQFSHVFLFTLLDIPNKLIEFLPSGLLIGTLLSLGQLAASSELVASSACGVSRLRIGLVACLTGLLVILVTILLVEYYLPASDRIAAKYAQSEVADNVLVASDESYWLRDRDRIVRIGAAISPQTAARYNDLQF